MCFSRRDGSKYTQFDLKSQLKNLRSGQVQEDQTKPKWVSINSDGSGNYNDVSFIRLASHIQNLFTHKKRIFPLTYNGRDQILT